MAAAIMDAGLREPVIIAGGSPTFSIHCKRKKIECSPGTFIYWDAGYADLCPEQHFLPAALVISRVIALDDRQFTRIVGMDVSYRVLELEVGHATLGGTLGLLIRR